MSPRAGPSGLDRRLEALAEAAGLADGRLDPGAVERARAVVARAGERLGHGVEATVVALAGPTGAGKSSLFNALAGSELTAVGVRRPTTSTATAAVWGDGAGSLLDWLAVPLRHPGRGEGLDGLVLLDLPDFDSVAADHRVEADRVIGMADLLLWVVDPQKYADATLHDGYLRPLARHGGAMAVVLNQADRLGGDGALARVREDLGRLLAADGLERVPVVAASARTGAGLGELREELRRRVAAREAALARLDADLADAAAALEAGCGDGDGGDGAGVGRRERVQLDAALAQAAGVPVVLRAVDRAHRRRGALATGWPAARWVRRLRPDPLRRLRLPDRGTPAAAELEDPALDRTSLPPASPVQRAQASGAIRALAASAAGTLPDPWPRLVREAAARHEDELPDRLDRAVAGADLGVRRPRWWAAAGALQKGLAALAVVGALWLLALAALAYLRLDNVVPTPNVRGVEVPTLLLLGGVVLGLVLAGLARLAIGVGARRRARVAERALRAGVHDAAQQLVVAPVEEELAARERLCAALATAAAPAGRGGRRATGSR